MALSISKVCVLLLASYETLDIMKLVVREALF